VACCDDIIVSGDANDVWSLIVMTPDEAKIRELLYQSVKLTLSGDLNKDVPYILVKFGVRIFSCRVLCFAAVFVDFNALID
jgi:hypothetical protein